MLRTYYCLWVFGARGPEPELAQLVFGLLREGVEPGLGRLLMLARSMISAGAEWLLTMVDRMLGG